MLCPKCFVHTVSLTVFHSYKVSPTMFRSQCNIVWMLRNLESRALSEYLPKCFLMEIVLFWSSTMLVILQRSSCSSVRGHLYEQRGWTGWPDTRESWMSHWTRFIVECGRFNRCSKRARLRRVCADCAPERRRLSQTRATVGRQGMCAGEKGERKVRKLV